MSLKYANRGLIILQIAERVLINNRIVVRIIEDTRRYPRLFAKLSNFEYPIELRLCSWGVIYLEYEPAPPCIVKI